MKECFKCHHVLPLMEFYRHPMMADGHLGKCKECTRQDVKANRLAKLVFYSSYERQRQQNPERRKAKAGYLKTHRKKHPDRTQARQKAGRLPARPCESCGTSKAQRHHPDYSQPLKVEWLCFKCHREKAHGQTVISDF